MQLSSILSRTREVCRRKHLSWATEEAYTGWIRRYATFLSGLKQKGRAMQYLHTEAGRVQSPLESLSLSSNQPQAAVQLKYGVSTVATPPVPQSGFTSTGDRLNERAEVDVLLTNTETRPVSRERSYSPSRAADQSRRTGTGLSRGERLSDTANYHRRGGPGFYVEPTTTFLYASDVESKNRLLPRLIPMQSQASRKLLARAVICEARRLTRDERSSCMGSRRISGTWMIG